MAGTLVVHPDSGEPVEIVPEAIERLMARFGLTLNTKGYNALPICVRLIQGDSAQWAGPEDNCRRSKP